MRCRFYFSYIVIFFVAFLSFNVSFVYSAAEVNLEDILEGIKHNESLVKSGSGTLIVKSKYTEEGKQGDASKLEKTTMTFTALIVASEVTVSYYYKGEKFRYDVRSNEKLWDGNKEWDEKAEIHQTYDGETFTETKITPNGISGTLKSKFFINPGFNPKYWGIDSPQGKSLADRIMVINPVLAGTEILEGDLCYIIRPKSQSEGNLGLKLWFDASKGYVLRRVEASNPTSLSIANNRLKEISKDIWVPYYEEHKYFLINPDTGVQILASEDTREIKNLKINVDIPDEMFKLIFEKGTDVYDERTSTSYKVE